MAVWFYLPVQRKLNVVSQTLYSGSRPLWFIRLSSTPISHTGWQDLAQYKLLILSTYQQFSSGVWLAYDQAFRRHAAATNLSDWFQINVQLFNFHASGATA